MRVHFLTIAGIVAATLLATPVDAAQKVLVLGAGDCREPTLTTAVKQFHDEARDALRGQLFEPDVVLDSVRPRPTRSLQDVQRQVDSARTLLYGGENERGLELVRQALTELDKAPPQVTPWPVTINALLVQSQLFKNLDRLKEMNESYRRVVRIDPTYRLDPNAYPPSSVQAFEAIRRETARARKAGLHLQSAPAGASVFVDGRELGKTPLKLELLPGTYQVWLMRDGRVSFPRRVDLSDVRRPREVQVDMGFEGAVSQQPPLCVADNDDDQARKLGGLMVADEVIVVRNMASAGDPPYIAAVLYDSSGRQVRNGGAGVDAIANLATFIITGERREGVNSGTTPPPAVAPREPQPVAPPVVAEKPTQAPVPAQAPKSSGREASAPAPLPLSPPPPPPLGEGGGPSTARIISYTLIGAGVATAVVGGVLYGLGGEDRDRLTALTTGDGRFYSPGTPNHAEALELMPAIDANRELSFVLIGAGAGAAAAGVLGALLFPGERVSLSLEVGPRSGGVTVSGRL